MPKKIMTSLSYERLLEVLDYNPVTGMFAYKAPAHYRRRSQDGEIGTIAANGRRYISIDRRSYMANRLAWFYVHRYWPADNLVPIDGDFLNLKIENWNQESAAVTARRSRSRADNTSGARGVSWDAARGKWQAGITIGYRRKALGRFDTKEEAAAAYAKARQELLDIAPDETDELIAARDAIVLRARCRQLYNAPTRTVAECWAG